MTIDVHPHVISTDTVRYPNAPLGGHKSDWSRERPVNVEQMIAAMDPYLNLMEGFVPFALSFLSLRP